MKEHIRRLEDSNNKQADGNIGIEEENLQSSNNVVSRLPIVHGKTKRVQCDGLVEARSSIQHNMFEDNNLLLSREKDGEHDNVIQLLIQQNSSSPRDPVMDYVPEVRKTRDPSDVSSARLDQQVTRSKRLHSTASNLSPSERMRTYLLELNNRYSLLSFRFALK